MIQQISNTEFRLSARGSDMTLVNNNGIWEMYVVNAAVKAYRRGIASPKRFSTLAEVEEKYNSWIGISALAN
jgi:hypothetical protein